MYDSRNVTKAGNYIETVCAGLPLMDYDGHFQLTRYLKLTGKSLPLNFSRGVVVIIVEPYFTYGYYPRQRGKADYLVTGGAGSRGGVVGVYAGGSVYKRVFFGNTGGLYGGWKIAAGVYYKLYAVFLHGGEKLVPVIIKLLVVIMGVCVKIQNITSVSI